MNRPKKLLFLLFISGLLPNTIFSQTGEQNNVDQHNEQSTKDDRTVWNLHYEMHAHQFYVMPSYQNHDFNNRLIVRIESLIRELSDHKVNRITEKSFFSEQHVLSNQVASLRKMQNAITQGQIPLADIVTDNSNPNFNQNILLQQIENIYLFAQAHQLFYCNIGYNPFRLTDLSIYQETTPGMAFGMVGVWLTELKERKKSETQFKSYPELKYLENLQEKLLDYFQSL